ncbi:hypothetical protein RHGRI_033952 [Rhododendron griersonianum]|uniref:Uncharacterized protein n=1 Tax=Rhododendron griersonianum TaxID=479676 RepID=A0AAV6HYS6_9ERIC|nr:hypothetical protein RHGRI_033952 [Rhododendron griersonianum]
MHGNWKVRREANIDLGLPALSRNPRNWAYSSSGLRLRIPLASDSNASVQEVALDALIAYLIMLTPARLDDSGHDSEVPGVVYALGRVGGSGSFPDCSTIDGDHLVDEDTM